MQRKFQTAKSPMHLEKNENIVLTADTTLASRLLNSALFGSLSSCTNGSSKVAVRTTTGGVAAVVVGLVVVAVVPPAVIGPGDADPLLVVDEPSLVVAVAAVVVGPPAVGMG